MKFYDYYSEFMGVNNKGCIVSSSEYRELPIHKKYYYPIIFTDFFDELFCSTKEKYFELCDQYFDGTKDSVLSIKESLPEQFRSREFYRYSYDDSVGLLTNAKELDRQLIYSVKFEEEFDIENYMGRNKVLFDEKRQFVILEDNKIASRALVSDVYAGGGNIVVYTFPKYRGKGYATETVKACINWCLANNVLPIYFVEHGNIPSIRIAENLGFKRKCSEVILQKSN